MLRCKLRYGWKLENVLSQMRAWLAEVQEQRQRIFERRGYLPDSTLDIAEDRRR